jgi:hypothetical protein
MTARATVGGACSAAERERVRRPIRAEQLAVQLGGALEGSRRRRRIEDRVGDLALALGRKGG